MELADGTLPGYALTLDQPWAELVRREHKRIETRSRAVRHRGWLAIHASRRVDATPLQRWPFREVLADCPMEAFPRQMLVAVAWLSAVVAMTPANYPLDLYERAFGCYAPGRYMWQFAHILALPRPIPTRGYQGLWPLASTLQTAIVGQFPVWPPCPSHPDDGGRI